MRSPFLHAYLFELTGALGLVYFVDIVHRVLVFVQIGVKKNNRTTFMHYAGLHYKSYTLFKVQTETPHLKSIYLCVLTSSGF